MAPNQSLAVAVALTIAIATSAEAQHAEPSTFRKHIGVEYGLGLFGATAYRTAVTPEFTNYVFHVRGMVDPLVGFRTEVAANINHAGRFAFALYGLVSTNERNRFYGFGNDTEPLQPSAFYRLEQLLFESGATARISLGGANNIIDIGPFYRFWNTDGDIGPGHVNDDNDLVDDGGVVKALQPYGVGRFKQLGLRVAVRGGTARLTTNTNAGLRFAVIGSTSPALLDVVDPTLSILGDVKAFLRIPVTTNPLLIFHGRAQRIFGTAPFQDAAYLGGRRTLKGFKKQQFAGDLALLWGWELRTTVATVNTWKRQVTLGPLVEVDVGRVYLDGASPRSWHVGAGGGVWLRDHQSGKQVSISLAQGDIGPRLYIGLGSPVNP